MREGPISLRSLLKIVESLGYCSPPVIATELKQASILIVLDLSADFYTIDHNILIHRLAKWVGLSDIVIKWLQTLIKSNKPTCHLR